MDTVNGTYVGKPNCSMIHASVLTNVAKLISRKAPDGIKNREPGEKTQITKTMASVEGHTGFPCMTARTIQAVVALMFTQS